MNPSTATYTAIADPRANSAGGIALGAAAAVVHPPDGLDRGPLTPGARWGVGLFITALLFGLLASAVTKGPATGFGFHGCRIDTALPLFGRETETGMRLMRDSECAIWLRTGNVSIDDLVVVDPPANGTLRARGRSGVIYRPAKDFTGSDTFVFAIKGREGGQAKSALVRVRVRVQ